MSRMLPWLLVNLMPTLLVLILLLASMSYVTSLVLLISHLSSNLMGVLFQLPLAVLCATVQFLMLIGLLMSLTGGASPGIASIFSTASSPGLRLNKRLFPFGPLK